MLLEDICNTLISRNQESLSSTSLFRDNWISILLKKECHGSRQLLWLKMHPEPIWHILKDSMDSSPEWNWMDVAKIKMSWLCIEDNAVIFFLQDTFFCSKSFLDIRLLDFSFQILFPILFAMFPFLRVRKLPSPSPFW